MRSKELPSPIKEYAAIAGLHLQCLEQFRRVENDDQDTKMIKSHLEVLIAHVKEFYFVDLLDLIVTSHIDVPLWRAIESN